MRRVLSALILLLVGTTGAYAQERQLIDRGLVVNRDALFLGAGVELVMEGTTNDAFEFTMRIDPTVDVTWELPASGGTAGQQLQTGGGNDAVLSWASAGSTRDLKVLAGLLTPQDALQAVLSAPIHRFRYKAGMGTQDSVTEYAGILANEAPWAMHFGGTILNPVNTAGYAFASIQALQAEIETLKAQIAQMTTPVKRRTWRTLWIWKE